MTCRRRGDRLGIKVEVKGHSICIQRRLRPGHVKPFDKLATRFDAPIHRNEADV